MAKISASDLAQALADESGLSKAAAKAYTNFIFKKIRESVENGDKVSIQSFGTFEMSVTAPRIGRNIHTAQVVSIPAKHKIKFEMSRMLNEQYNKKESDNDGSERS